MAEIRTIPIPLPYSKPKNRGVFLAANIPARVLLFPLIAGLACFKTGRIVPFAETPRELTPREHETAALVASGLTNKQIAQTLGLTEGTVKLHLHSVFVKLGIHRRAHLILHAESFRHS